MSKTHVDGDTDSVSPHIVLSAADFRLHIPLKPGWGWGGRGVNAIRAGFDGGHGLALFRAQPLALRDAVRVSLRSSPLSLCFRKLIALKNYLRRRHDIHS